MAVVLGFDGDINPFFRRNQAAFDFIQRRQVLIDSLVIRFAQSPVQRLGTLLDSINQLDAFLKLLALSCQ